MAEEKHKSKAKPAPKVNIENETTNLILLLVFVGFLAGTVFPIIIQIFNGVSFIDSIKNIFLVIYRYYSLMATFVSVLLATGIAYCLVRLSQIRAEEAVLYNFPPDDGVDQTPDSEIKKHRNQKWVRVEQLIESQNPSDWRLAIIEADILLDEMLSRMPYPGETIADKLKIVEKSDFNSVESAWEAHKSRNQIVHAGSDYALTEHEAKRVINLYREVFEEFFFV